MRTIHLLVNPSSKRGTKDGEAVRSILVDLGVTVEHLRPTCADDVAASIDRAGPEHVVAVGGDGLIHRALPALAGHEITLGIVPSGTGNDFARALGLPARRRPATRRAIGSYRAIDLLRIALDDGSTAWAATVVTSGFSGRVNQTANERSFPRGQLKYTVASFTELGRLASFPMTLRSQDDDEDLAALSGACTLLAIANTRYFGGGMAIAPTADPTDGLFDVTIVGDVPAWQLAAVLPTVFVGQHVRHPEVRCGRGANARVGQPEDVWADGELIGRGPFSVEVVGGALRVAAF